MKQVVLCTAVAVGLAVAGSGQAQFHNKDEKGQVVVNRQAQSNAMVQKGRAQIGRGINSGMLQGASMYLPSWASEKGIQLSEMGARGSFILGQTVRHSDGRYTETTREKVVSSFAKSTQPIEQTTFSPEGIELSKRRITFDEYGNPKEVIIRDAKGNFKYRGLLVYDPMTRRLKEEQIYDVNNILLRRNIQDYDPAGNMLPYKSVDYVANVPDDLELVITEAGEKAKAEGRPPKRFFQFGRKKDEAAAASRTLAPAGSVVTTGPVTQEKEKKGFLKGVFGKKGN